MKKPIKRLWKFLRKLILGFFIFTFCWVLLYRFVNPPVTVLQLLQGKEGQHAWVSIEALSDEMPLAVIASEDQRFLKHYGFDREAIAAAYEYNKTHQRKLGASTISQQTAKNVFLWPSRSWLRKGLEAYFTVLIELLWSKERIIEVYLNVIEMGPQCFGAEAAARRYFNKSASAISRREAALIAAALPHPRKSNPGRPSAYLVSRGKSIEKRMRQLGGVKVLPWNADD